MIADISESDVRDMMLEAVERRFTPVRLPDRSNANRRWLTLHREGNPNLRIFVRQIGLKSCFTPVKSV